MRLALVTQDFPPALGGIQSYCWELARRLQTTVDDLVVVAPQGPSEECAAFDKAQPFEIHRCKGGSDVLPLSLATHLPRLIGQRKLNAVFHAQWQTLPVSIAMRRLGKLEGAFVAAHGRELWLQPLGQVPLLGPAYNKFRRSLLAAADGVFPVSHFTQRHAIDRGANPAVCHVVNNGTDPTHFYRRDATELRARLGLGGKQVLLFAGRLVHNKGVDTALAGLADIVRAQPQARLVVVGQGPDRSRLEALAQHYGIADSVLFLGRVPYEELPTYYSLADVFVTLSREEPPAVEGFGLVFLEAGACQTAVIGADSGGIPDAVIDGTTGILVPPGNPEEFTVAALRLLGDEALRRRLGDAARAHVLAQGNWDYAALALTGHMRSLLAASGPP